jgi:uncharacterized membrane protein HdeD (DUF308 family)
MTGEIETRRRAAAFLGNVIAILGLLVLGYPLAPAAIRSMLLGWALFVVATAQFIWRHAQAQNACFISTTQWKSTRFGGDKL